MVNESQLTFRIPLWRPWLLAVALLALPAVVVVVVATVAGRPALAWVVLLFRSGL